MPTQSSNPAVQNFASWKPGQDAFPAEYRSLYQQLLQLQDAASSYVDPSRLQLALRSLESSTPVIRIALLGLGGNGARAARKLARALLGDPLSSEQAWEKELVESAGDGRNILIKFGEAQDGTIGQAGDTSLLRTLQIPSPYLQKNNLEILVSDLNTNGDSTSNRNEALADAILVPSLTTPTSAGGRVGFVRYPVHKAMVVTEGVTGAIEFGRFPSAMLDGKLISAALGIPLKPSHDIESPEQEATSNAVDIDLANHALKLFRTNKANGAVFSDEWQTSRISAAADWIAGSRSSASLHSDVQNLIYSILSTSSKSLSTAEFASTNKVRNASVSDAKRATLESSISAWSAEGHKDLQSNLDHALSDSAAWRRTAWWRLFWRIDDVSTSTAELLRRSWLTEAEQRLAFLSGQIVEADLANEEQMRKVGPVRLLDPGRKKEMEQYEPDKASTETVAQLMQMPSMLASMQQKHGINAMFDPPWPQNIKLSREYMVNGIIPELHSKAQSLLVTTMSTIGGSTLLAAWWFVVTAGTGHALYESGAIAALGLVWGIRRLQKRWSRERDVFADLVREDGRRVLGETEQSLRKLVREGGHARVREEDVVAWSEAREGLRRCSEALEAIGKPGA